MRPDLLKRVIENISKHEGRVSQMYLDTKGIVTAGVGHAIFKVEDACCLSFHKADRPATRQEIIADYTNVKYAKAKGSLFLPVEEMDRILAYDLGRFVHITEETFPGLYSYPDGAIIALLDICLNCGSFNKWPCLKAAVKAQDWTTSAAQSNRPQVGRARNDDTYNQFISCCVKPSQLAS